MKLKSKSLIVIIKSPHVHKQNERKTPLASRYIKKGDKTTHHSVNEITKITTNQNK